MKPSHIGNPFPYPIEAIWGADRDYMLIASSGWMSIWRGTANGTQWSFHDGTTTSAYEAVWGSSRDSVWGIGQNYASRYFDGGSWAGTAMPPVQYPRAMHGAVAGANLGLYAVGYMGGAMRWNGSSWTGFPSGQTNDLEGIWAASPDEAWAVGGNFTTSTLYRWDSRSNWDGGENRWSPVSHSNGSGLNAVWGNHAGDIWAVGWGGRILHWDGGTWDAVPSGVNNKLLGVYGTGPDDVWAVGEQGSIVHWNGQSWSPDPSGTAADLWCVWSAGPTDVVWVGGGGPTGQPGPILLRRGR